MFMILVAIGATVYAAKNGWLSMLEQAIQDQISKAKEHNDSRP
jgi:hypothetical protein